jgi:polar amino acid transport system substrate-binding protein
MIRKSFFAPVVLSFLIFLLWTLHAAWAGVLEDVMSKGELAVSTSPVYAPQSFLNDKGKFVGFDIDVAKEVAKRLGVTVKFVTPRWDWIVAGKWRAHWDLSIGSMTITEERAIVLNFSIPYYYTPAQFALHETNKTISAVSGFTGKTIGVGMNTTYESYLDPNKTLTVKRYLIEMEMLQDLALGDGVRLDGILTSGYVVADAINKGLPLKPFGNPVFYEPLAAACDKARPGSKEFIKRISTIFESMHEDGTLTAFSMKWYGVDISKKVR